MAADAALGPEVRAFTASPRALLLLCGFAALLTAPLVVKKLVFAEDLSLAGALAVLLAVPAAVLLVFLLAAPLLWVFKVRVHELGIQAYDAYGRRAAVSWSQVLEVSEVPLLNLGYLRLRTTGAERTVWLPLFLSDRAGFDRLVVQLAGSWHPLSRALAPPGS
jgi:hypothetical protein